MSGLRDLVYNALVADAQMNLLGFNSNNMYPIYARDTTPFAVEGSVFGVLRWGATEPGIAQSIPIGLDLWLYSRQPDYDTITRALMRARVVLAPLVAQPTRRENNEVDGWITSIEWQGGSPDLFDDLLNAYTRNESYRIVASGI